jgi:signal transduction histidine kinase
MFLRKLISFRGTLSFKLTFWFAGLFSLSSFIAFNFFYLTISYTEKERTDLEMWNDVKALSSTYSSRGLGETKAEMFRRLESEGIEEVFFRLVEANGEEFVTPNLSNWGDIGIGRASLNRVTAETDHIFETLELPGRTSSTRLLTYAAAPGVIVQMGRSLEYAERFMEAFGEVLSEVMTIIMTFAVLGGFFMARRALAGVEEVTRIADEISKGDYDRRVLVTGRGREIEALVQTFNRMLDQIQTLVRRMREMTDNIAHDLRSPIARIRGIAETTLVSAEAGEDFMTMAGSIVEESDRLLGMINAMLDISEAEAGVAKLAMEEMDLADLARDACDLFQPVAETKGIRIIQQAQSGSFTQGDRMRIQRAVSNLLDNALKYTPPGGTVTVTTEAHETLVTLSVLDTGIGISENDLPRVFDRFFRGDRSRSLSGTGLGLTLARAIAHAHGGEIQVTSSPGKGSSFTMTLPRVPVLR